MTNISKYKEDLDRLEKVGASLYVSMLLECDPKLVKGLSKEEAKLFPNFKESYQGWYSEALAAVRQLLPDRLEDFVSYYKLAKPPKSLLYDTYTISDYLQGLHVTRGYVKEKVVGPDAAVPKMAQQLEIVKAIGKRFESSLFDIRALLQADLFDSELDAAEELNKKGFQRGAGAIAGVALEHHLASVCDQHKITHPKNSTISPLNDALKKADVIDVPTWRFIQRLMDLRNLCDHKKMQNDPTKEDIVELIAGVRKVIKTVF